MRGIALAGGNGGRLKEISFFKPGTLVYDKPMINYPLETLREMGCDENTIVTNKRGRLYMPGFIQPEFSYDFAIQEEAKGMADAIEKAKFLQPEGVFPVIAGDFYFDPAPEFTGEPTLFWSRTDRPQDFGVYDPKTERIVEKPVQDIGNMAIVACYIYDGRIWEAISTLEPSARGELEITDVNNWYLERGIRLQEYTGFWGDMGTPDGLLRVANYISKL